MIGEFEYEIGGQQRTSTLKIKKDGDNLAGTMSWPDQRADGEVAREPYPWEARLPIYLIQDETGLPRRL